MNKHLVKEYSIVFILFLILLSVIFYPAFWQGKMIYGEVCNGSDSLDMNVPRRYLAASAIRDFGELPFWSSHFGCGFPIQEEGETAVIYPFSLIPFYFFSSITAVNMVVLSSCLIAALGMYVWLRFNGLMPMPAFVGAIAWSCCGSLTFRIQQFNNIHVLAWLPFSMMCIQALWQKFNVLYAVGLILIWCLQILAGHPQMFVICVFANAVFCLCLVITTFKGEKSAIKQKYKQCFWSFGLFVGLLTASLWLSAVQWLPTYELLKVSNRSGNLVKDTVDVEALRVSHLANWLFPFASGNPAGHYISSERPAPNMFVEATPYIGVLPLLLAGWCLFVGCRAGNKKKCLIISCFGSSIIIIWIAMGPQAGIYTVLCYLCPFFSSLRCACRWAAPVGCFGAVLSGLGAQYLYESVAERYKQFTATTVVFAVLLATAADFSHINWSFQSYLPLQWLEQPPSVKALDNSYGRILSPLCSKVWEMQMSYDNYGYREQICYAHRDLLGSELASLWKVCSPDDFVALNYGMTLKYSYRL